MAKRMLTYKQEFLALGFIEIKDRSGVPRPQCVVCMQLLSNESLKINKLKRHLEKVHPTYANKPLAFWKEKETQAKRMRLDAPSSSATVSLEKTTYASFEVALKVAQCKKPHSIAEQLIKPAAIAMARTVCGDEIAKKLEMVPISNDTVKKRIDLMSLDILEQLITDLKKAIKFSIQIDESVDIEDFPQLLVYVRYRTPQNFNEEFLFCEKLSGTTTGADIFLLIDKFFVEHQLLWDNCLAVCTDGAPAMIGSRIGFCAKVKERNPDVVLIHCFLHRENLATRDMQPDLHQVLKDVIQIINFIKARAMNSRIFRLMCEEMGSDHQNLLYHSDIRWLSRGKILARVLSLKTEIEIFLTDKRHECADRFSDNKWMAKLAYLGDIFHHLNQLNTEMQGQNRTVVDIYEKITVFKNKIKLWQNKIAQCQLAAFPTLNLFLEDLNLNGNRIFVETMPIFLEHLTKLENEMERYIPQNVHIVKYSWVRNPFEVDVMGVENDSAGLQEELLEMQGDAVLKERFARTSLTKFWAQLSGKPVLSNEAEKALLPFPTTYLCEAGFSCLAVMKNKYRSRLDPQHDMRCALSINITPRIHDLCSKIQHQGSH